MTNISSRQLNGIVIVDLCGRVTLEQGSALLRETIRNLIGQGQKNILLNLADVTYIDSSGIGELVSAYTNTRGQGGDLKLLNLTQRVRDLLQTTKLDMVFDIQEDEASALSAFGA